MRADVTETLVQGDRILVGLMVGNEVAADTGGSPRWQVLTVKGGLVTDIRGFGGPGQRHLVDGMSR